MSPRETIPFEIKLENNSIVKADVLLDDGATTDNYISDIFVDKYLTNYHVIDPLPHRIGTGFNGLSGLSNGKIRIFVRTIETNEFS